MHVLINKYMTHIQIKEVETGMENVTTVFHDGKTEEKIRLLLSYGFYGPRSDHKSLTSRISQQNNTS